LRYYSRHRLTPEHESSLGIEYRPWRELLSESDVVSVHVPLTPKTTKLFDQTAFAQMKSGAVLVNTSRGEVVDESALADALRAGRLAGAG
jgi:lactate dehydrogenase-like 2-hydroxyacid dehydrogenase